MISLEQERAGRDLARQLQQVHHLRFLGMILSSAYLFSDCWRYLDLSLQHGGGARGGARGQVPEIHHRGRPRVPQVHVI